MSVDVAAIRAALDKATPGPWMYVANTLWRDGESLPIGTMEPSDPDQRENAELIVLLRNNAEALLDALENR